MVGYYLTITDPNKSSINMEFFKGTTKFTTGQAPKDELVRGAPSTSMSTPASGTLLARPVQEATLPPTPPNSPVGVSEFSAWGRVGSASSLIGCRECDLAASGGAGGGTRGGQQVDTLES